MAVQQNKPTRSKRGMRRSHDALTAVTSLSVDKTSGEKHLRQDRKSTRLNSSHPTRSRMPSSA